MSQEVLNKVQKFGAYKFEQNIHTFVNQYGLDPDIDAMLEIMNILDSHKINYKIGGGFHIRIMKRR